MSEIEKMAGCAVAILLAIGAVIGVVAVGLVWLVYWILKPAAPVIIEACKHGLR